VWIRFTVIGGRLAIGPAPHATRTGDRGNSPIVPQGDLDSGHLATVDWHRSNVGQFHEAPVNEAWMLATSPARRTWTLTITEMTTW